MKKGKPQKIRNVLPGDIIKLWFKDPGELILIPYINEEDDNKRSNETNALEH